MCHVATKHNPRKGRIFEKVRHVTAVSNTVAKTVKQGATVIYNGIVPVAISPDGNRNDPFRILAIGRLDPIKGFDRLIAQAAGLEINFRLEIIGDGPQREMLQNQIDRAGLNNKVELPGFCDNIPERMSHADLVVISSHSEGFPIVLIESLFYANLLVSTPVGGSTEILDPSLLAGQDRLSEKITDVAGNYKSYRDCFLAVQDVNRNLFMIEAVAKSYVEFYRSVYGHE